MRKTFRSRISKRHLLPAAMILIAIILVALLFSARPTPPENQAEEKSWPIQTTLLKAGSRAPQLRLLGRIETPFESTLSAAVTADVAALPLLEGQSVDRDQVIIELDNSEVKLLVDQRQADVTELESQISQEQNQYRSDKQLLSREKELVALSKRALDREQRLSESNLNSQSRMDQAREATQAAGISLVNRELAVANHTSRLKALQARLARAQALLEQARLDLERTRVRAPFTGTITDIQVSPGERVRPGEPLVSLYASGNLEVRAQIPMNRIATVRQTLNRNGTLAANIELAGKTHTLTLARLSGQVNTGAGGIDGLFRFTGPVPEATLNRTVDVTLELPEQPDLFSVPVSALYDEDTLYRVDDGRLLALDVTIVGDRYDHGRQSLLIQSDSLSSGDRILRTQLPNAISGLRVNVMNSESDHGG